jgi:hypothetical protein
MKRLRSLELEGNKLHGTLPTSFACAPTAHSCLLPPPPSLNLRRHLCCSTDVAEQQTTQHYNTLQ